MSVTCHLSAHLNSKVLTPGLLMRSAYFSSHSNNEEPYKVTVDHICPWLSGPFGSWVFVPHVPNSLRPCSVQRLDSFQLRHRLARWTSRSNTSFQFCLIWSPDLRVQSIDRVECLSDLRHRLKFSRGLHLNRETLMCRMVISQRCMKKSPDDVILLHALLLGDVIVPRWFFAWCSHTAWMCAWKCDGHTLSTVLSLLMLSILMALFILCWGTSSIANRFFRSS